jgi:hypothetical protein
VVQFFSFTPVVGLPQLRSLNLWPFNHKDIPCGLVYAIDCHLTCLNC